MYGRYEIDELLDSEYYWKDKFDVQFVQENYDGTDWWRVIHKESKRVVSCTSMVQAFRICVLAQERIDLGYVESYYNHSALSKACYLVYGSKYYKYEKEKMLGYRYFNNKWVPVKRK